MKESCLDCEINFTAIIERCAHTTVLHQPGTQDKPGQGADLRILTVLKTAKPGAKSLLDSK